MPPTRVLMAAMTPLLGDIVEDLLAAEPDLNIVGRIGAETDPNVALERLRPDVVITDAASGFASQLREAVLSTRPRVRVLTLVQGGRGVHLDMLVPHRVTFHDVSSGDLVNAIRGDASDSRPSGWHGRP